MMETLKDVLVDVLILLAGLVIVTAEGIPKRGVSCDGRPAAAKAAP